MTEPTPSSAEPATSTRIPPWVGVVSAMLVVYALTRAWLGRWVCDDAFISFRYAENLVRGWGLVWNVGERVEGITNFLWTLLLVPFALGEADLVLVAQTLGIASLAWLWLVLWLWFRAGLRRQLPLALWATLIMQDVSTWASGGLETMTFTALAATMAYLLFARPRPGSRSQLWAGLAGAMLWLLRPDGALIAAILASCFVVSRLRLDRRAGLAALSYLGLPLVCAVVGMTAFRLAYYDAIVPNTFYAKNAEDAYWGAGLRYLGLLLIRDYALGIGAVLGALLVGRAWRDGREVGAIFALTVATATFIAYVARTGGDFMFARRLIPVVPLGMMALERLVESATTRRVAATVTLVLALLAALPLPVYAWWGERGVIGDIADEPSFYTRAKIRLREVQGKWLAEAFQGIDAVFLMEGGLCMLAYYSRLPTIIDYNGLTDRAIAYAETAVRGRPGHEKYPSPAYLAQRRVDFIILNRLPPFRLEPNEVAIGFGLVPLRWVRYDDGLQRRLAVRPGVMFAPRFPGN